MANKKKYKLSALPADAASDGAPPPCAFFVSAAGCRNGDSCRFSHEVANAGASKVQSYREEEDDKASVVSSETSVGRHEEPVLRPQEPVKPKTETHGSPAAEKSKKPKRKSVSMDAFPFANPKKPKILEPSPSAPVPTPAKPTSLPRAEKPAAATTPAATAAAPPKLPTKQPPKPAAEPKTKAASKTNAKPSPAAGRPSLQKLLQELPIASFTMPSDDEPPQASQEPEETSSNSSSTSSPLDSYPIPRSHADGVRWLAAIQKGRQHARFQRDYNFTKYMDEDENNGCVTRKGWIVANKYDPSVHAELPQVIAMDCEMCETEDPVSGKRDARALCRISVVDAVKDEVLLDTLVKPSWPVRDYRTWVNGIKEKDLENVQFTLRHAQAFMMALCSEETVIVGHALQNDLAAIRMEHYCVADSALLFQSQDSQSSSVSLKDLSVSLLKTDMPKKHDSVNDARTAWKCLEHYLERDGNVEPIERLARNAKNKNAMQLFVHRIPQSCDENHLMQMFLAYSSVQPEKVNEIAFSGNFGKTHVTFRSTQLANMAFDGIEGNAEEDPSGRLQKKVFLKSGGYIRVRKMAYESKKSEKSKAGSNA